MKETLTLAHPIEINGKTFKSLDYDTDEITAQMFIDADSQLQKATGNQKVTLTVAEFDRELHLYIGFASVIALNPEIDYSDLLRIKGADIPQMVRIGRSLFSTISEEPSEDASLETPSEPTVESTTLPRTKSGSEN